jgi:hypothetical protein
MSESPPQAQVIGSSELLRHPQYLTIGCVLLAVAAVAGLIVAEWIPNFLAPLSVSNEVWLYVAELVGFYAVLFLLVGLIGAPASPRDYFGGAALIALGIFAFTAARDLPGMRGFAF